MKKSKFFRKREPLNRSPTAKALELAQFKPRLIKDKKKEAKIVPDQDDW